MVEKIDCPRCFGTGWQSHDWMCAECGGSGEIDPDDLYDEDQEYDEWKDDLLTNPEWFD